MSSASNTAKKTVEFEVAHLVPGMELADDIISEYGKVLCSKGSIINQSLIDKFLTWDINKVPVISEININPIADPNVQKFINSYNKSVSVVQKAFDDIRQTQEIPMSTFENTASSITDNVSSASQMIDQLYNLPPCDDYTFRHCVNVSAIAALIATWLKSPPEIVNAVSLAALLHDVGKSQLPVELLKQGSRLSPSEYSTYKAHVLHGIELARKTPGISRSIVSGIGHHHEREDGSGYPKGLMGKEIHPYAKIIAVADLYDEALTINSTSEDALSPYQSLEKLRAQIPKVDAKTSLIFIDKMTDFLSGNIVALTDGRQARVVFTNKEYPSRSIVQFEDGVVLDLSQSNLSIHYIVR
ncbi:MAG: HD-GYP domain-containing protein [Pelosinus sp.]|nr:HD-GYP domain-containing protein [Pelosinus sp.]